MGACPGRLGPLAAKTGLGPGAVLAGVVGIVTFGFSWSVTALPGPDLVGFGILGAGFSGMLRSLGW